MQTAVREILRKIFAAIAYFAAVPVIFVLLPFILPYAYVSEALHLRRLAKHPCNVCGTPIGRAETKCARAASMLMKAGFSKVVNLDGGITGWNAAGYETTELGK